MRCNKKKANKQRNRKSGKYEGKNGIFYCFWLFCIMMVNSWWDDRWRWCKQNSTEWIETEIEFELKERKKKSPNAFRNDNGFSTKQMMCA